MIAYNGLNLTDLSRIVLAVVCLLSAGAAGALALITHPKHTPHMILVAFWSLWAGVAMTDLALRRAGVGFEVVPLRLIVLNLNGAFSVVVGGWALFAIRLWHEAIVNRRAESLLAKALQTSMETGSPTPPIVREDVIANE